MSTEETTIFNEGTTENVAMNDNRGAQPEERKAPEEKVMERTEESAGKQPAGRGGWQQVVIGGVSGILLGGAGVFFSSAVSATDDPDAPTAAGGHTDASVPVSEDVNVTVEGLPVATVSDDMSFAEAFAAARAEVGAGGVFEWHGGVYGTYYAEEWNSMTPEEQQAFGSHLSYNGSSSSHSQQAEGHIAQNQASHAATQHEGEITEEESGEEDGGQQQQEITENTTHGGGSQNTGTQTGTQGSGDDDGEVQVLDVSEVTLENGSAVTVGQLTVDGQDVLVVDVDQDGTFDLLAMDVNQDGEITSDEMVDIQEDNLTVDALRQSMEAQESTSGLYASNMPDYTNDADPSSYA